MGRFMVPKVLYEPSETFLAGYPKDYPEGTVDTSWVKKYKTWIIHHGEPLSKKKGIYALIAVCTHLGCTPLWDCGTWMRRYFIADVTGRFSTSKEKIFPGPLHRRYGARLSG